jgi:hypothetical protein
MEYVKAHLPHPDYVGVEIDRIDNDGNYAPGNLKLSTKSENNFNKQNNLRVLFNGNYILIRDFKSPYTELTTRTYVKEGLTGEQIIERARATVLEKQNNRWKSIAKRLAQIDAS